MWALPMACKQLWVVQEGQCGPSLWPVSGSVWEEGIVVGDETVVDRVFPVSCITPVAARKIELFVCCFFKSVVSGLLSVWTAQG